MGLAQFNKPTSTDKRLFLMSDTQSRVTVRGPNASTALNLQLKAPDAITRATENLMYADPITGLLRLPDLTQPRFEVNGTIVEPEPIIQYVRETQNFADPVWTTINSPVISLPTQVDPRGVGASAQVLTGVIADGLSQIMVGLDPVSEDYRLSVFLKTPFPLINPVPDIELFVNFSGSTPDAALVETIPGTAITSEWQRFDLNAFNANAAHNAAEVRFNFVTAGEVAIWGANFTGSDPAESVTSLRNGYLSSYRPRAKEILAVSGRENLVYPFSAMGIEPTLSQEFTLIWEFIPLGEQGRQVPQIAFAGGSSHGVVPPPPGLYQRVIAFGAHPSVATDFRLAIADDVTTPGVPVVYTHSGTYNWARYSHQKWAFVIFNDGSQKCRFFANGTFLGETVITGPLTADNFTKFVLPSAAIHRRIELLAEALSDATATAATTI
ncbi:MAG: hypothetical protein ACXABY_10315 [Candidatus Thorarchaeota archaeon]|jgi:hypothetical protein